MKKIASYLRTSSNLCGEDLIEKQQTEMIDYASKELHSECVFYIDRCLSSEAERPAYTQLMEDLTHGNFNQILVPSIGTIHRSADRFCEMLEKLHDEGISIISKRDGEIDYEDFRKQYELLSMLPIEEFSGDNQLDDIEAMLLFESDAMFDNDFEDENEI